MRSLTYVLRLHRPPTTDPDSPAIAHGLEVRTVLEPNGVSSTFLSLPGQQVSMANGEALSHDETMFFEWGSLTFGSGEDTLSFESVGPGVLLGQLDAAQGFSLGVVSWRVTAGTGFFAGATGAITSNFLIDLKTNELIDNQVHVVYIP